MADAPSTSAPQKKAAGKKKAAAPEPKEPFKPAKYGLYERQVTDYIRTATAVSTWLGPPT